MDGVEVQVFEPVFRESMRRDLCKAQAQIKGLARNAGTHSAAMSFDKALEDGKAVVGFRRYDELMIFEQRSTSFRSVDGIAEAVIDNIVAFVCAPSSFPDRPVRESRGRTLQHVRLCRRQRPLVRDEEGFASHCEKYLCASPVIYRWRLNLADAPSLYDLPT